MTGAFPNPIHPNFPLGRLAGEFYDNGRKFVVSRRFQFVDPKHGIDVTIEPWTVTDLNSSPRPVWWFFSPAEYPAAGAVHDEVYRNPPLDANGNRWTRENCDWVHWRILTLLGCPGWKAEVIFQMLSKGSKGAWNQYREKERHA